ncbi:MAG TPA: metallophosphoesterase family protein [Gemmataceae bacterium]|nr:metallophosphoesterase family protein [Gemmataceae bacterium]
MRTLAIGDIHGCSQALRALLDRVEPTADDRIITLGDYVDRGPDSYGVIEQLLALHRSSRLIALLGNHEDMMLEARKSDEALRGWLDCGGKQALASYSPLGDGGKLVDVPDEHWDFLENVCVAWYETDTHIFVHANVYPDLPMDEQPDYMLRWESIGEHNSGPHCSGKVLVCGHTQQRSGLPLNLGHAVCIDTWAYGNGWLTCLDVMTGRLWQANQAGRVRTLWLDEVG